MFTLHPPKYVLLLFYIYISVGARRTQQQLHELGIPSSQSYFFIIIIWVAKRTSLQA